MVAWNRVGNIKNEMFLDRYRGPSIELLLSDDEINGFFRKDRKTKIFFGRGIRENGYFKVGYSNAFKNTDKTVRVLNEYKSDYDAWFILYITISKMKDLVRYALIPII